MRRLAAQNAAEGDESVEVGRKRVREGWDFESARDSVDRDRIVRRSMPREAFECSGEQSLHDFSVETAGDHAEAQTLSIVITFKRTGHLRPRL